MIPRCREREKGATGMICTKKILTAIFEKNANLYNDIVVKKNDTYLVIVMLFYVFAV